MTRIRLVWSKMWSVLADYFVTVGCSDNLSVAMYAMDSLRQLAMKFLEREELSNYNFQNEFMKPFVIVMRKSNSVEIRELIIRCVSQMVFARVGNVKSGWKIMFMVSPCLLLATECVLWPISGIVGHSVVLNINNNYMARLALSKVVLCLNSNASFSFMPL